MTAVKTHCPNCNGALKWNGVYCQSCGEGEAEFRRLNQSCNFCAAEEPGSNTTTIDVVLTRRDMVSTKRDRVRTVRMKLVACQTCQRREAIYFYLTWTVWIACVVSFIAFLVLKGIGSSLAGLASGLAITFVVITGLLTGARYILKSFAGLKGWMHMSDHPMVAYWRAQGYLIGPSPWFPNVD